VSSDNQVIGTNTVADNCADGIALSQSSSDIIGEADGQGLITANGGDGINIISGNSETIIGYTISSNAADGIWVGSSIQNSIGSDDAPNVITANGGNGISVVSAGPSNYLTGNHITDNVGYGMYLEGCIVYVVDNKVTGSGGGWDMWIDDSEVWASGLSGLAGSVLENASDVTLQAGIEGSALLSVEDIYKMCGVALNIEANATLADGGTFLQQGGLTSVNCGALSVTGLLAENAGVIQVAADSPANPSVGSVSAGGGFHIASGAMLRGYGIVSAEVHSYGSILVASAAELEIEGSIIQDAGLTDVNTGNLVITGSFLENAGAITIAQYGLLTSLGQGIFIAQGATLSGPGTITVVANIVNSGTITIETSGTLAVLNVDGNYTQTSTGVLFMNAADDLTDCDQLNISGNASLDGSLVVSGSPPVENPVANYLLITWSTEGGVFASVSPPPGTWNYIYHQNPGYFLLQEVSGP
jgi:hypothetical protein